MNWLNIELNTLRSEEYLGSDPVQRGTWLNLLSYCADQENGGTIKDCKDWGDRRWLQLLGVTKEEVLMPSDLWKWSGSKIIVWNYPKSKEAEVRRKRESGKKGGRPPKIKDEKPDGSPDEKPDGSILQKRKGKERKGKEDNIYTDVFEKFWKVYPKKKGKGAAAKSFDMIKKRPSVEVLIRAVESEKQSDQWNRENGQFIPNPSTWLNQRRWDDGDGEGNPAMFTPFTQNGQTIHGEPLCNGLTRSEFKDKFGRLA